jgi:hypothetical protein
MGFELKTIISWLITGSLLCIVIYIPVSIRMLTFGSKTILDYDPWWFYRHSLELYKNNFVSLKWDLLSYFPPGRVAQMNGWTYTMAFFFKIFKSIIPSMSFVDIGKLAPVIMVGLSVIPGYLLGKLLSNKWGGLATALFATLTPTFIGVSMAGYGDTDAVVVFYSLFSAYTLILASTKRKIPYYILAIIANLLFIWNWYFGWYVIFFYTLLIPFLFVFRILEEIIHERKLKVELSKIINEIKPLVIPTIVIFVVLNIIGIIFPTEIGNIIDFIGINLGFVSGRGLIVNVSVAELQPINILTKEGFDLIAGRIGLAPTIFTLIGLLLLVVFKVYKKVKIHFAEIFLFLWALLTFYMILHGVRFSLQFSIAASISAGYFIGNLVKYLKKNIIGITVLGLVSMLILMFVSNAVLYGYSAGGMEVSGNWIDALDWLKENANKNSLVETWWDPGHIIAGYTGLKVHADGAHCGPAECIPNNHDVRIQDMGKIMSTNDGEEALSLITKYKQLNPEECQEVKRIFGDAVPEEACEPVSEIYFIASSDLIGKFTWMNYFGGYRAPIASNYDFMRNPGVCCAATPKTEPGQVSCGEFANQGRGVWVWCPWIFSLKDAKQDQEGNPVYVYDYAGLTMTLIQRDNLLIPVYNNQFMINHLTFFYEGQQQNQDLSTLNTTLEKIDGLIWLQPDFRSLIYFAPAIKDSMFTRLFFYDGEGLEHFEQVFSNSEIRLYRVK